MLTPTQSILKKAQRKGYAVGAFNINNMEIAQAVVEAAEREKAPILLQTSEGAIAYAGMGMLLSIGGMLAARSRVPIALHLDHGKNVGLIQEAIGAGYQSVMFDGSSLPYEENVKTTKKLVAAAHKKKISVEAELGAIAGIEDFVSVTDRDAHLTDPEQARAFVRETGCDFLAVAVGTAHGAYKFKTASRLDIARLQDIKKKVRVPLVLHGASSVPGKVVRRIEKHGGSLGDARGVSDADLKKAIRAGIAKVNTDTDIRLAFTAGIRETLSKHPDYFDPRKIIKPAYEEMVAMVRWKIKLLGSSRHA